jgi:hypothetical protein
MYKITPEQVNSVDDVELAFSTTRLLPKWEDIPEEFKSGNIYTQIAEALFYGNPLPDCSLEMIDGVEPQALNRCITAHLKSFGPKHEHKIAGVGFMLSSICQATVSGKILKK